MGPPMNNTSVFVVAIVALALASCSRTDCCSDTKPWSRVDYTWTTFTDQHPQYAEFACECRAMAAAVRRGAFARFVAENYEVINIEYDPADDIFIDGIFRGAGSVHNMIIHESLNPLIRIETHGEVKLEYYLKDGPDVSPEND